MSAQQGLAGEAVARHSGGGEAEGEIQRHGDGGHAARLRRSAAQASAGPAAARQAAQRSASVNTTGQRQQQGRQPTTSSTRATRVSAAPPRARQVSGSAALMGRSSAQRRLQRCSKVMSSSSRKDAPSMTVPIAAAPDVVVTFQLLHDQQRRDFRHPGRLPAMKITEPYSPTARASARANRGGVGASAAAARARNAASASRPGSAASQVAVEALQHRLRRAHDEGKADEEHGDQHAGRGEGDAPSGASRRPSHPVGTAQSGRCRPRRSAGRRAGPPGRRTGAGRGKR